MLFRLSDQNIQEYLISKHIYNAKDFEAAEIELKSGKNFNLLIRSGQSAFLVKQERYDSRGSTQGEFWNEWRLQEFLHRFPELEKVRSRLTVPLHFDPDASIVVFEYLTDYGDLSDFYDQRQFPPEVAAVLGRALALIHRSTYQNDCYKAVLTELSDGELTSHEPRILSGLGRVGPAVFGKVRLDGLEFFRLYQRYESLGNAIATLKSSWNPCCLIHADLRFSNVLLYQNWQDKLDLRIIDWEKFMWGDPAFDVGMLIAGYLRRWIDSLVVHRALDLSTMLQLARLPLPQVQPSMAALVEAYLDEFSELLEQQPDFLQRVLQFAGLLLIEKILISLEYHEPFDNTAICMLQVAKSLLCNPQQASLTVFGSAIA